MGDDGNQTDAVRVQATEWFARLKTVPVSRETLEAFFEWRRGEGHAEAFEAVERLWTTMASVAESPAVQAATDAAFARGQRQRWHLGLGGKLITVAGILVLGIGAITLSVMERGQIYRTATGQQSVVTLEDGSKVTLDTDTSIRVRFEADERRVTLDHGQAYFAVAHASDRPFTVRTAEAQVLATGTQFEVGRLDRQTDVTLVEGSVRVDNAGASPPVRLSPGQKIRIDDVRAGRVQTVNTATETAWMHGRLILDGLTLAEAVTEMNRYTTRPIRLDARRSAHSRLSGSLDTGDVRDFITAATAILPVKAAELPDGTIRLSDLEAKTQE